MILDAMLQRLYASLVKGPSLNARPHHSRQRVDLKEVEGFQGLSAASVIDSLLGSSRSVDCPAKVSRFEAPKQPEREWTKDQRRAQAEYQNQLRLLNKFHDIAIDGRDYFNDHGEDALFLAYPILSVPAIKDLNVPSSPRVLAPVAFMPVSLDVKRGSRKGIQLRATGEGADLLVPNPALLAWVEQQTGKEIEDLFGDEEGSDPWKELREILGLVTSAMGIRDSLIAPRLPVERIPKIPDLPSRPSILPCAVLGLFPMTNPGLMRDTKWMMEREEALEAPVGLFLNRRVLELRDEESESLSEAKPAALKEESISSFAEETLVTQADPCQAEAVQHARSDEALVIHGPPGTGKSQTISNIIGDHLARNQRVLFVCDKRTALDVVKYRLDALGLGELCGVIHDVQRDRRGLYMGIRERLEKLIDESPPKSPLRRLENVNEKLDALRSELQGYYDTLHASAEDRRSFHDLIGGWMRLRLDTESTDDRLLKALGDGLDYTEASIDDFMADIDECLQHAANAELGQNPFFGRLQLTLSEFMSGHIDDLDHLLSRVKETALELDANLEGHPLSISRSQPLENQMASLVRLRELGGQVKATWVDEVLGAVAQSGNVDGLAAAYPGLMEEAVLMSEPVERELEMACPLGSVGLGEINSRLQTLDSYQEALGSWTRIFAFGKRKAAEQILGPLGLSSDLIGVERGLKFLRQLRAGVLLVDFIEQALGTDVAASSIHDPAGLEAGYQAIGDVLTFLKSVDESAFAGALRPSLSGSSVRIEDFDEVLRRVDQTLARGRLLMDFELRLQALKLFTDEALEGVLESVSNCEPVVPVCDDWIRCQDTLEDVLRYERRSRDLPGGLLPAVATLGLAGIEPVAGLRLLRRKAVEKEIQARLVADSNLLDITSERVEAALKALGQRLVQKEGLVRELALFHWRGRQHSRLLAQNGSRLNSLGASLRQRLFIRGKRALKLRQMIQAGQGSEDGDPLFDLCPVWMASPSTVAQIFPREPVFDVIIFDEASQCRLEEALPVLLRGKRVVIAGDPKQLPPTRFFESAVGDSEFADAESLEELQEQQLSETEDLLSAALNLDLQSCHLDVHYRSQSEALIGFSNQAFYRSRLQPIPGHPQNRPKASPLSVYRVDGTYRDRSNPDEAAQVTELVASLLGQKQAPSIGIACFNLNQRDVILESLEKRAAEDRTFSDQLETARNRQGKGSFEGLFVKNLENVQGDERDHIIISTTFGPAGDGKFRRHFGALSRHGGERRLNVLVTRARERIHIFTSIPREEYVAEGDTDEPTTLTGRHYLYRFLRFAENVEAVFDGHERSSEQGGGDSHASRVRADLASPSVAVLAQRLAAEDRLRTESPWGNEGFCVDVALMEESRVDGASLGVFLDFNRYRKTPDPIKWEHFRSAVLKRQGWDLRRVWSPELFRKSEEVIETLVKDHQSRVKKDESDAARG